MLRERARVRPDPHRNPLLLGRLHDHGDLVGAADVAGIDADGCNSGLDRLERERGVEVDVGDDRQRAQVDDLAEGFGVLVLRHCDPHELAAGRRKSRDLLDRGVDVPRIRERHGLHDDGRAASDRHVSNMNLALARHGDKSNPAPPRP
jgi:hypothetical protein